VRRRASVPIALMGYLNPVLSYGLERFFDGCVKRGVDAVILPDLPPEEASQVCALAAPRRVATVFLLAPTSTPARCQAAFARASGFLYFVSVTGVTGARTALPAELGRTVSALRARAPVPLVVGFGISTPAQAKALGAHADGVVVGSAIVSRIAEGGPTRVRAERVRRFVRSLKRALPTMEPLA
jgi:tryptophan synthase alpha chain